LPRATDTGQGSAETVSSTATGSETTLEEQEEVSILLCFEISVQGK